MSAGSRAVPLPRPAGHAAGFTLVELLVALTLFAILSVLLFGGFHFGVRAWEVGSERIDRLSRVEPVQNLLRRQLSQVSLPRLYPTEAERERRPTTAFIGTGEAMIFIAPLPAHEGLGGLYVFSLSVRRGSELVLGWRLFRPDDFDPENFEAEEESVLLGGISGAVLSYYGVTDPDRPPQWNKTWDGTLGPPELIRLRVTFPPDDLRRWPDLVVSPRIGIEQF
jgi:general secretion pathway protein J